MRKSILRRILNRVLHLAARNLPGTTSMRPFLHRLRGVKLGRKVFIGDDVYLENEYPENVEILDNTILSTRCMILAHTRGSGRVTIGPDVLIGPGVMVVCPVNKTLVIGAGTVISSGSVITSSIAKNVLVVPARSSVVGRVTVPWSKADTFDRFIGGVRPLALTKKRSAKPMPASATDIRSVSATGMGENGQAPGVL